MDAGIIILKATDNRFLLEEMLAIKVITNFFKKVNPICCWLCITHCDLINPDDNFIKSKIGNIEKYGLKLDSNHVIKFNIKNHR